MTTPRSLLFVPGDRPDRVAKAIDSGADVVIVDLEDGVAAGEKATARDALGACLSLAREGREMWVRINGPTTEEGREDLVAVAPLPCDAVMLPKALPEAVAPAAAVGRPVIALIETAAGILRAPEIAAHAAVAGLMIGQVDLSAELRCTEGHDGDELLWARSQLVLAAAATGLDGPIDGPCIAFRDPDALAQEITRARRLGFAGKACIHPNQVDAVNRGFAVADEELDWAEGILATAANEEKGSGVSVHEGTMVDKPVITRARAVIDRRESERGLPATEGAGR